MVVDLVSRGIIASVKLVLGYKNERWKELVSVTSTNCRQANLYILQRTGWRCKYQCYIKG